MTKNLKNFTSAPPLNKAKVLTNIAKSLDANTICYVLITCEKPQGSGSMHVDLVFEGDKNLAQHLIKTAQSAFSS